MSKTLFLHVGMPKCASSSIQAFLGYHHDGLAARGLYYDTWPQDRTTGQGNAAHLLASLGQKRPDTSVLDYFLQRDGDVILSNESVISLGRSRAARVLVDRARAEGFDVRLICYVRRQDLWIESDFKQQIKGSPDWVAPIEDLIAMRGQKKALDYHWMLSNWAKVMDPAHITLVPLVPGQSRTFAIERFLTFVGQDPALAQDRPLRDQNVSPPVALIEPARHVKRACLRHGVPPEGIGDHVARFIEDATARLTVPDRPFLLSQAARGRLVADYGPSNARLAADFHGGVPVFGTAIDEDPEGILSLADEATALLIDYGLAGGQMPFVPDAPVTPPEPPEPPRPEVQEAAVPSAPVEEVTPPPAPGMARSAPAPGMARSALGWLRKPR